MNPPTGPYIGLVTRSVAFAIDAAIINGVALVVAAGSTLIFAILHLPDSVRKVLLIIGGGLYVLWTIGYLVGFWASTGQTPGARIMRFRVVGTDGALLGIRRGVVRCVGLLVAALPLLAGYLMIPFDDRRRGLHDRIARTVVVDAPTLSLAEQRRADRSSQTGDA